MIQLRTENLTFSYKTRTKEIVALSGLSMSVEKGSFCAVIGPNGSGKSTLAKLFNALEKPTSGKVFVNGLDSSEPCNTTEIRKVVGLVFQNPDNQIVGDTVEDDVAFGPENLGLAPSEIEQRVSSSLKAVGIENLRFRNPLKLSGGQKQRVSIAGALALGSECLVLDEATAMLDPDSRKEVLNTLHSLNREKGTTVIIITNYTNECLDCDCIYVLDKGRLVISGTPSEVFSKEELEEMKRKENA